MKVLVRMALVCVATACLPAVVPGAAVAAPTAPSPLAPAANADVRLPFAISWSAASDPSGVYAYNWQISAGSAFGKVLRQDSTMGELRDTVSGLAAGTYYWRVQGVSNDFVTGAWSAPRSFRVVGTTAGVPASPVLNLPRGGTHFHPWESFGMSWSAASGATRYILEASKDSAFPASGVVFRWESETPSTEILITHFDMGDYKARVFAVGPDGESSMPSNVIGFRISYSAPIAAPPAVVAPSGGVTTSLPITFQWTHVVNPQSSGYEIEISRSATFSTVEERLVQLNGPTYTVVTLPTAGTKYWRVRSHQGMKSETTTATTAWSAAGTFTVSTAPPRVAAITLSRPAPASGQEVYVDLQLSAPVPASGGSVALSSSNPAVAPVPASVPVQGGTSWTQFRFWTGQVDVPTAVTLTARIGTASTSTTFTVSPASLKGLEGVPLRTSGGAGLGAIVMLEGQAPPGGAVVSLSSSSPAATPPATVTVPAGVESTYVQISTTAVAADTPVTITATWKGVTASARTTLVPQPAPTSLTLDPATTSGSSGSFGRVTIAQPQGDDVLFAVASSRPDVVLVPGVAVVPAGVTAGGFFISTFAVSTRTPVTISVTGGGVTLTATLTLDPVAAPAPTLTAPALLSPAADARFLPGTTVTFDWSDVAGAAAYRLQVSTSSSFGSTVLNRLVTPSQHATATLPTADLWFRVRAESSTGTGPWSATRAFRVKT